MAETARLSFIKDHIFLFILLALFIVLKIPHLYYSFYWDESWPYASAISHMYEAGPGLLPGVIPADYSRGHPLLFHFLAAVWMKIFGTSHTAMHAFPLFLSVLGLAGVYEAALKLFNRNVAMISTLLIAFQVMFFVHSSFLLLEIFLAFLGFFSVYFYARRKYFWTIVFLTALFYTKESGMVLGVVLGFDALFFLFRKDEPVQKRMLNFLSIAIPVLLIGLFFVLQRFIEGWFVFPFHTGLIDLAPRAILTKIRGCFDVIFVHDLRQYFLVLLLVLFIIVAVMQKGLKTSVVILKSIWYNDNKEQQRFLRLLLIFIPLFFLFTSVNMFIGRYLFLALIPILFTGSVLLERYAVVIAPRTGVMALLLIIAGIEAMAFYKNRDHGDTDFGAFDGMHIHGQIVKYLEDHQYYHHQVSSNAYLERVHLTDPYTGYLKGKDTFSNVTWQVTATTDIAVFDNIEPDYQYDNVKADTSFKKVFRIERGTVWGEIYIRKALLRENSPKGN
jgi:4-amino-4-deoxy-L-arabinose transferase-like glycosyltransferase